MTSSTTPQRPEQLELFLFDFCPFAQQVQLILNHAGFEYDKHVLDPANMPRDFKQISPLGNVPVLRVNNQYTVFESLIINHYLASLCADTHPLLPDNALQSAQMQAWCSYHNNTCLPALMTVVKAEDEENFTQARKELMDKMQVIAALFDTDKPRFFLSHFSLLDACFTTLFLRMQTLHELLPQFHLDDMPQVLQIWKDHLLSTQVLQQSIIGDFTEVYRRFIGRMGKGKYIDRCLLS